MPKYVVHLTTWASTSIEFETDLTDPAEIEEAFWESEPNTPSICAQCSGWGRDTNLELGDEWEIPTNDGVPLIDPATS